MKKLLCLCLMLLCLAGCSERGEEKPDGGVKIYYIAEEKDGRRRLEYEVREVAGTTVSERARQIVRLMKEPLEKEHTQILPDVVTIREVRERGNTVYVDYIETYSLLGADEKAMATAALCSTLLEYDDVDYVRITYGGETEEERDIYYFSGRIKLGSGVSIEEETAHD